MKAITFKQLDRELKELFGLEVWGPIAEEWEMITHEEIDNMITLYPPMQWMNDYPCGWIARGFAVDVTRHYADGKGLIKAIGSARGEWVNGTQNHTVTIYRDPSGIFLIDLQTGERWRAEKGRDEIFFVEM